MVINLEELIFYREKIVAKNFCGKENPIKIKSTLKGAFLL